MTQFLSELLLRLFGDTPWFFKVVRIISIVLALITGLPTLIESSGIVLPDAISILSSQIISVAALLSAFIAQLTVTSEFKKREGFKD
jgi:hypothetical protein